jgi:hypothetical protein
MDTSGGWQGWRHRGPLVGACEVLLDAGNGTRPRFTSLDLLWQVLDRTQRGGTVGETAISDHVERLALQGFLEVAVLAALLAHVALRGSFVAGAQNLHHIVTRRLAAIPATGGARLGGYGFFRRLQAWRALAWAEPEQARALGSQLGQPGCRPAAR